MLSYLHGFHAGNGADVHKHAIYVTLLKRLADKAKPFTAIDLYAGSAVYDLTASEALKTGESVGGIAAMIDSRDPSLAPYLALVQAANAGGRVTVYPGSPELARRILRHGDELIVNELHPREAETLRRWAKGNSAIHVHKRDAIEALTALLPPRIRRGIVLIDPPYEVKSEYGDVAATLPTAIKRWPEGIFMLWYPILDEGRHADLKTAIEALPDTRHLYSEIDFIGRHRGRGMAGSGIAVIHPPWHFEQDLRQIERALAPTIGTVRISA